MRDMWQRAATPGQADMFVTAEGIDHHVKIANATGDIAQVDSSRPVSAMIHGSGIDTFLSFYFALHHPLAELGFTNIMYDRRAHGRTPGPPGTLTIQQASADLAGILDAVGAIAPVHLIGSSYGAAVAIDFAAHYPERTASVVLLDGGAATRSWREALCNIFRRAFDENDAEVCRLRRAGSSLQLRRLAESISIVKRTTLLQDTAASRVVDDDTLNNLIMPILAVYGEESETMGLTRHDLENLPNFEAKIIPGVGHYLISQATASLRRLLLDFYRRHESRLVELNV